MATDDQWVEDALAEFHQALAALRLAGIMAGEIVPREDEPIDLVLMASLAKHYPSPTRSY